MSTKRVYLSDRPLTIDLKELRRQQDALAEIQAIFKPDERFWLHIEGVLNLLGSISDIVDPPEGTENYARTYRAIKP